MAQYLSQTGQLPQAISWFQQRAPALASIQAPITAPSIVQPMTKEQELQILESQATALESQLKQIRERINQLKEQK